MTPRSFDSLKHISGLPDVGPRLLTSLGKYHGSQLTLNTNNYCRKNYFPKTEKRITNRYH